MAIVTGLFCRAGHRLGLILSDFQDDGPVGQEESCGIAQDPVESLCSPAPPVQCNPGFVFPNLGREVVPGFGGHVRGV